MHVDEAILRHLRQGAVKDQHQLQTLLASEGIRLTVSTLSRRLQKLGIRKVMGFYRAPEAAPHGSVLGLRKVAPCLLILRTQPGLAQALAVSLDQGGLQHLGGSVSGYDTIFLAPTEAERLDALEGEVRRFLRL